MSLRALATAVLFTASPLTAQTDIRPQDATRLATIDAHLGVALRQALTNGRRGDIDMVQEALSGPAIPALRTSLAGDWSCRMIKMGGAAPLTVYAQFDCHFTPDGDGFLFEKRSGSERTIGRVSLHQGQMIYLGTRFVAGTEPIPYSALPPGPYDDTDPIPQLGVVEQSGDASARILFPDPATESRFDLLYLTR